MPMRGLIGLCFYSAVAVTVAGAIAHAPPVAANLPPVSAEAAPRIASSAGEKLAPSSAVSKSAVQIGIASWYGPHFQGRRTADGARYDMRKLTAAHRTLPLGSKVRVTNLDNGRSVEVTINDRGPVPKSRVIDLSKKAAQDIGIVKHGVAMVRLDVAPVVVADNDR
jgi:rare lipoprotein A